MYRYQDQVPSTQVVEVCQNIFIFGKYLFCRGHLQTIFLPLIISLSYTVQVRGVLPARTHVRLSSVVLPVHRYRCTIVPVHHLVTCFLMARGHPVHA
jgi:hypothetical protein